MQKGYVNIKEEPTGTYELQYIVGELIITRCRISVKTDTWTISSWFTANCFQKHGYGKRALLTLIQYIQKKHSVPQKVEYIWNGENQYVYDWLIEKFGAVCQCDIAVVKKQPDDDMESHIYTLDVTKFLLYCSQEIIPLAPTINILQGDDKL